MASDKKKRKAARQGKKQSTAPGTFRHRDGDRRRRGLSIRVEDAIAAKRAMQSGALPPPPPPDAET